jgi:hypothetical protein
MHFKTHPLSQTARKYNKLPLDLGFTCNEAVALLRAKITAVQCSIVVLRGNKGHV